MGGGLVGINSVGASIDNSYATGAVSVTSSTLSTLFGGGLVGSNSGAVTKSYATGAVDVTSTFATATAASAGGLIGSNGSTATLTQSYATGAASAVSAAGTTTSGGLIGRNVGGATVDAVLRYRCGRCHLHCRVSDGGWTDRQPRQHRRGHADLRDRHRERRFDVQHCGGWRLDRIGYRHRGRHGVLLGHCYVREGECRRQRRQHRHHGSHHQPDAESGKLCVNLLGWNFATVWSAPSAGYYPQLYGVNYVLRVDPANASRVYGDANPAFTYSIYGFHTGDTAGIVTGLAVSTAATATSNVGAYAISASGGSAVSASGQAYRFIDAPGTLTITPRAISVTADNQSRVYGNANPVLTYQVGGSGLVNGDTLSGALATPATAASSVGVYGITQGTLGSPNYTISSFAGANLTVTPRAITVTADAMSRAYGDTNPALTYQVGGSGLANGDTLSGALATSATSASNVGLYGITQGTLAASTNYTLFFIYRRRFHHHAACDHGDGRCQELRLWRRQSGADLSGRRLGPRQWRHAVRRTGDISDNSQQCRRLRHHAGHARGLDQLRTQLCKRQPDRHAALDHRDGGYNRVVRMAMPIRR